MRFPSWLTKKVPPPGTREEVEKLLHKLSLHTVCQEARCPNLCECFSRRTATFMILGNKCTRNCTFCAVEKGSPLLPSPDEPENVAKAVAKLELNYVVVTSPTRDDLPDGGAGQFARTVVSIKKLCGPETHIEVLIPDFNGSVSSLKKVITTEPLVVNHNLETVPRLYPKVRPQAKYERSLDLLRRCKKVNPDIYTKSGLMVGLGEEQTEVTRVMKDLREANCDILTLGQYLRPSPDHLQVKEFIPPPVFDYYKEKAYSLGFLYVASAPFVRSSYMAREWLEYLK